MSAVHREVDFARDIVLSVRNLTLDDESSEDSQDDDTSWDQLVDEAKLSAWRGEGLATHLLSLCTMYFACTTNTDPLSHREAMLRPDAEEWRKAEKLELDSLLRLNVFEATTETAASLKVKGSKMVYKLKMDANGKPARHKCRLVAKGFTQIPGEDYFDIYSPVARLSAVRLVYALSAQFGMRLSSMDVETAFLNAKLTNIKPIYMALPKDFEMEGFPPGSIIKLKKSIYGLKQAPREWNVLVN